MNNRFEEICWNIFLFIFYFTITVAFTCVVIWIIKLCFDPNLFTMDNASKVVSLPHVSIAILTAIIAAAGWLQFSKLNSISRADFILRIDNRYGSKEIIRARAIIQRLYREASPLDKAVCEKEYLRAMAKSIDELRSSTDSHSSLQITYLLNFLDFLETIAYFTRKKFISVYEVDELLGHSLIFYFKVYKPWIYDRRVRYQEKSYYSELENLIEKIETNKLECKVSLIRLFFGLFK